MVSYMGRMDGEGLEWVYPEEAQVWDKMAQILKKDVKYRCSVRLGVSLTSRGVSEIKESLYQQL